MCYVIYISTTSQEDFGELPKEFYRFENVFDERDEEALEFLRYPNKWYLSCRYGGCSCHYRHLVAGNEPEFGPPEDWCSEDDDDIESTAAVYDVFARVIAEGHKIDVLDSWNGKNLDSVNSISVLLTQVPRQSFRFFENYRFDLLP